MWAAARMNKGGRPNILERAALYVRPLGRIQFFYQMNLRLYFVVKHQNRLRLQL